jgi:hypothetical protein
LCFLPPYYGGAVGHVTFRGNRLMKALEASEFGREDARLEISLDNRQFIEL